MKKVIIGLAIFICAMFVGKNVISAEDMQNYYVNYYDKLFSKSSYVLSKSSSQTTNSFLVDSFVIYDKYKINLTMDKTFNYNGYYYLLYNKTTNQYAMQYFASEKELNFNYTYSLSYAQSNSTADYTLLAGNFYVYYNSDFNNIQNGLDRTKYIYETDYKNLGTSTLGANLYNVYLFQNIDDNLKMTIIKSNVINENDWEIVSTNIKSNIYKTKNEIVLKFYENETINYAELDINNKYAVLFYPKEYNLLEKTCSKYKPGVETDDDGNVTVIPDAECIDEKYKFEFKQKGKFSFGFADLNTMDVVTAPLDLTSNFDEYLPFENYLETDEFKGGLIFYNRNLNQTTDDDGNVTISYGTGSIKYNSDLYNYLIINDKLDKINETICLKDKNNKEKCYNIKNIPGAYDTADKKINNDTDSLNDFDYKNKLDNFIYNLKDSFEFLKLNMKLFLNKVPPIIYLYIIVIPLFLLLFKMMK